MLPVCVSRMSTSRSAYCVDTTNHTTWNVSCRVSCLRAVRCGRCVRLPNTASPDMNSNDWLLPRIRLACRKDDDAFASCACGSSSFRNNVISITTVDKVRHGKRLWLVAGTVPTRIHTMRHVSCMCDRRRTDMHSINNEISQFPIVSTNTIQ